MNNMIHILPSSSRQSDLSIVFLLVVFYALDCSFAGPVAFFLTHRLPLRDRVTLAQRCSQSSPDATAHQHGLPMLETLSCESWLPGEELQAKLFDAAGVAKRSSAKDLNDPMLEISVLRRN